MIAFHALALVVGSTNQEGFLFYSFSDLLPPLVLQITFLSPSTVLLKHQ